MASSWGASWGTSWANSWGVSVAPPAVVEQPSGGYWPDYGQPRRRRIRETHDESPAELQARLTIAAEQIKERAALRKAEARSRYLTEQIRAIYEEQDRLAGLIVALSDELDAQDEEEVALIMALAG